MEWLDPWQVTQRTYAAEDWYTPRPFLDEYGRPPPPPMDPSERRGGRARQARAPRGRGRTFRPEASPSAVGIAALFHIPDSLEHAGLDAALGGLQGIAEAELASGEVPWLYESGVKYIREKRPKRRGHITEHWMAPSLVVAQGGADCEDLAAWRAAELRVSGEDVDAQAIALRSGPRTWHAVVLRGDGSVEDPSAALGMKGRGKLQPPVRFHLDLSRPRDYHAAVRMEGLGAWEEVEQVSGCAVCALGDALDAAPEYTAIGQIPIISPILDIFSDAASLATGRGRKQAPQPQSQPQQRALEAHAATLEEGVLELATTLKRIVEREVARKWRKAQREASR